MSENVGLIFPMIASHLKTGLSDQQNHWGKWGLANIFRHTHIVVFFRLMSIGIWYHHVRRWSKWKGTNPLSSANRVSKHFDMSCHQKQLWLCLWLKTIGCQKNKRNEDAIIIRCLLANLFWSFKFYVACLILIAHAHWNPASINTCGRAGKKLVSNGSILP